jgi:hypothetical protein
MRRFADDGVGHGAEASGAELGFAPAVEFAVNLVPPVSRLRAAGLQFHILQTEAQQDRLFRPLVHMPIVVALLFGDAQGACAQSLQRGLDGIARFALGGGGDGVAGFPRGLNSGFKGGVGHGAVPFAIGLGCHRL